MGAFAGESVIDEIAEKLGIDPVDLRLKNAAREGTRMANGVAHPCIGAVEMMEAVYGSTRTTTRPWRTSTRAGAWRSARGAMARGRPA